jgi:hypothetical protein
VPFGPADQVDRTLRLLGDLAGDPRTPDGLAVA